MTISAIHSAMFQLPYLFIGHGCDGTQACHSETLGEVGEDGYKLIALAFGVEFIEVFVFVVVQFLCPG